jgi:3-dehydroquinate synthase
MIRIDIPLGDRSYPVLVGHGLLRRPGDWSEWLPDTPRVVITNDRVGPLHLDTLTAALEGRDVHVLTLPDGEEEKSFHNYRRAIGFLAERGIRRDAVLVALGGGVIGDLCGFVAATWMRGVRFVQVPTTLLAQVDASVGGKTAINIPEGKNLVGAFHQPSLVVADIATLDTLDDREYRAGLAEVVKIAAIRDPELLTRIEHGAERLLGRDPATVAEVVAASVRHKAEVVAEDEREAGVRALLNLGHTFGHAIEAHSGYGRYLHGEAVAMGMVTAARLSERRNLCPPGLADRLAAALHRLELPVTIPPDIGADELLALMQLDKKHTSHKQRFILLRDAGDAIIDAESGAADIRAAIEACRPNQDTQETDQ